MSVASGLYKNIADIRDAFNFLAGNTALRKRKLVRGEAGEFFTPLLGIGGGLIGGLITSFALAPVLGPAAVIPAVAVEIVCGFGPAALNAAYIIGKDENKKTAAKTTRLIEP